MKKKDGKKSAINFIRIRNIIFYAFFIFALALFFPLNPQRKKDLYN